MTFSVGFLLPFIVMCPDVIFFVSWCPIGGKTIHDDNQDSNIVQIQSKGNKVTIKALELREGKVNNAKVICTIECSNHTPYFSQ